VTISVSGNHYTVSNRMRTYADGEMARLEKFYTPFIDAHRTITEEGRLHKIDLLVNVQAHTLKSSGEDYKVYPAIGQSIDRMVKQLKKHHDKQNGPCAEAHADQEIGG
jgi:putative sigma-54 modulation protein